MPAGLFEHDRVDGARVGQVCARGLGARGSVCVPVCVRARVPVFVCVCARARACVTRVRQAANEWAAEAAVVLPGSWEAPCW